MAKKKSFKQTSARIFDRNLVEQLLNSYKVSASNIVEIAKDAYWQLGEFVKKEAELRCPVDTGTAESSITIHEYEGRGSYRVSVSFEDVKYPATAYKDGRTTFTSWFWIHEYIEPEGPHNLGKKSKEKQDRVNVLVGGGFLRRAIDENTSEIKRLLNEVVQEGISKLKLESRSQRYSHKRKKAHRVGVDNGN